MFKWMKRKRAQSQPPAADPIRLARSIEEEEDAVAAQTCDCAGMLRIKKRLSREAGGHTLHDLDLECEVCFQRQQWTFKFEGDTSLQYDTEGYGGIQNFLDDEEEEFRPHHYIFAHRILPQIVFDDPDAFYGVMRDGRSAPVLEALWHRVGEETGQPIFTPYGETALKVRAHDFLGRLGVVIELPEPRVMTEAWYIAVISDDQSAGEPWRYLMLENTDRVDENPRAVLCEWFNDGSRQNHQQTVLPTFDNMVKAVERHLTLEEKRRYSDMSTAVSARWQPGKDAEGPPEFDTGMYRLDLCRFSFHTIPDALANNPDDFFNSFRRGNGQEYLQALWLGSRPTEGVNAHLNLRVHLMDVAGVMYSIIEMPEPLAPPEPYLLGFVLPDEDSSLAPKRIYTLEMASVDQEAPPLLCSLDPGGTHGISGQIPNVTPEKFAEIIVLAEQRRLPSLNAGNTLMHLMLYAEISSQSTETQ
jgi:heat shock protein HspQ